MYMLSALPCSTTLVSPPAILTPGLFRGLGHGANFRFQNIRRQSGFQNKSHDDRFRPRAGHREIVHRAVDGQLADGAAGKTQRLDHKTVRGHGDSCSVDLDVRGIAQRALGSAKKKRSKQSFD